MLIIPEARVVYVLPPKCGTHTTTATLNKYFPDNHRHCSKASIHAVLASPEWDDYTWVMNVRNPFTRAVSWWNYHRNHPSKKGEVYVHVKQLDSFDAAGRDPELCWGRMNFWWRATLNYYWAVLPRIDHVVRVETFQDDFNNLPFVRDRNIKSDINQECKSNYSAGSWWRHYTSHMVSFVEILCAGDFRQLPTYSTNLSDCLSGVERVACAKHLAAD